MVPFIFVIVCGIVSGKESVQVFSFLFLYYHWRSNYQEGVRIKLTDLTPIHVCVCPIPRSEFSMSYVANLVYVQWFYVSNVIALLVLVE